jgi:methyl-accepting chemotaxis protein
MSGNFPLNKGYAEDSGHNFAHRTLLGGGRVGTRVSIFIWLSLLSLALLGGGFVLLQNRSIEAEQLLAAAKILEELTTGVERQTLQLRNAENSYLLDNDPKIRENFDKTASEINKNLNELYGRSDTGTVRDHITTINDGLAQYTEEFSKLVNSKKTLVITETDILARQVAVTAKMLERALAQITEEGDLRDVLARIRRHEKDFLLHGDPRLLSEISKRGQKFDGLAQSSSQSDDVKAQLIDLMQLYQSNVTAFARARITNKNNVGRLNEIFAYMIPSVDGLSAFASNNLKINEQNVGSIGALSRVSLVGGGGLLLFMLMISGIILLRSLTLPISESASAASQLVSGNLEVEIPALGNGDEIGELARALAIFGATLDEVLELRTDAEIARAAAEEAEARLEETAQEIEDAANEAEPVMEEEAAVEKEEQLQAQVLQRQEPETRPSVPSNALTGPISTISQQVAQSSKNVTDAAYEAERTGALTQGLTDAVRRLAEIKDLLSGVEEQADFLVFKPGSRFPRKGDIHGNLVVLSPENRSSSDQLGIGDEAVGKRFDIIRATNNQISRAIKDISELISDAKNTAHEIASNSSEQALKITSDLLKQSEYLRWMLNEQVGKLEKRSDQDDEEENSSDYGHKPPPSS